MSDWHFLAGRIDGDGGLEIIETDLPIEINSIESRLSAPPSLGGSITNRVARLTKGGRPILEPWNTLIVVTDENELIRGMGAYQVPRFNGDVWELDILGLSSYPQDMPFIHETRFIDADPLDVWRYFWDNLQGIPGGNIGVTIDRETHSPVRIGAPAGREDATGQEGPRVYSWWDTPDVGSVQDGLVSETPFDWRERHYWDDDGLPHCHLDLGYPQLGGVDRRRSLVLGENLLTPPSVTAASYLTGCHVLGAGEGRKRIHAQAGGREAGRVRRIKVIDDPNLRTQGAAQAAANRGLARDRGQFIVDQLDIVEHKNMPIAAIELGNEYRLEADLPWVSVDQYVRVVGVTTNPQERTATLTVVRSEVA